LKRLFLIAALFAAATTASASVSYEFHYQGNFGTTDWRFTVPDFISTPGTTYITAFDSYSSTFLGATLFDVRIIDPFSASPFLSTDTSNGGLSSGGWVGPFDHADTYSSGGSTLTITSTGSPIPEPSSIVLTGLGGLLFALVSRRHWTSRSKSQVNV
jgi:hypothetical protein